MFKAKKLETIGMIDMMQSDYDAQFLRLVSFFVFVFFFNVGVYQTMFQAT